MVEYWLKDGYFLMMLQGGFITNDDALISDSLMMVQLWLKDG